MTPGSAHPFRPSPSDRARCADCSLGADRHALETLLATSIDATAHRTPPKRLGRPPGPQPETRADRLSRGLPVCVNKECGRAPLRGKKGKSRPYCLTCSTLAPGYYSRSGLTGPLRQFNLLIPLATLSRMKAAARALTPAISEAEWVRRAIGEALERKP